MSEAFYYLMMNKPMDYVCSTCSDRRHTIYELLSSENCVNPELLPPEFSKINPVGRLDAITTGLILLTNDGMFNHNMTIPENHIPKTYYVELETSVDSQTQQVYIQKAKEGILLPAEKKADEYFAKGAILQWKSPNSCLLTISEGKFHQVRRTFTALGNTVIKLHRQSIGQLCLDESEIPPGKFRVLNQNQLNLFK